MRPLGIKVWGKSDPRGQVGKVGDSQARPSNTGRVFRAVPGLSHGYTSIGAGLVHALII